MSKIIIGIDPDSKAHGVAVYFDGKLERLKCLTLVDLMQLFRDLESKNPVIHIENVNGVSASFKARDSRQNMNVKLKMANYSGMCKQSQVEVERMAAYFAASSLLDIFILIPALDYGSNNSGRDGGK